VHVTSEANSTEAKRNGKTIFLFRFCSSLHYIEDTKRSILLSSENNLFFQRNVVEYELKYIAYAF